MSSPAGDDMNGELIFGDTSWVRGNGPRTGYCSSCDSPFPVDSKFVFPRCQNCTEEMEKLVAPGRADSPIRPLSAEMLLRRELEEMRRRRRAVAQVEELHTDVPAPELNRMVEEAMDRSLPDWVNEDPPPLTEQEAAILAKHALSSDEITKIQARRNGDDVWQLRVETTQAWRAFDEIRKTEEPA